MLFAEITLAEIMAIVMGPLSAGAVWVWMQAKERRKAVRNEQKEDCEERIKAVERLVDRSEMDRKEQKEENKKLVERIDAMHKELTAAKITSERAVAWIRHLEAALERANIPYRAWTDTASLPPAPQSGVYRPPGIGDTSANHTPLPPQSPPSTSPPNPTGDKT